MFHLKMSHNLFLYPTAVPRNCLHIQSIARSLFHRDKFFLNVAVTGLRTGTTLAVALFALDRGFVEEEFQRHLSLFLNESAKKVVDL